jgi:trigger factor
VAKGKTLEELRQMAREELGRQKATQIETNKRQVIMNQLLSQVECELPADMVRTETRRILADVVRENQARGVGEDIMKENEQQLVGSAAESARERLKSSFILMRIGEAEGIKVTQEEFNRRIAMLAMRLDMKPDKLLKKLDERNAIDQITEEILTAKVLDFLSASASVTTVAAGA